MRRFLSLLALVLALWPALAPADAPDMASLIADRLTIQSGQVLVAEGHVEIFYQGRHLMAAKLTYDRASNRMQIEGPIWIDDGKGNVFQAQMADLSADLTEGILRSARLVLNDRLQMAAGEVIRTGAGRYTVLRGVAASSCTVCKGDPVPLWEIRADTVVHDDVTHQIWFSGARLRFAGVPLIYLPELRVPDPTLKRATGFLLPSIRSTTRLGTGLKFPYFLTFGASRDLTVTPYLTSRGDQTLGLVYRQAFRSGSVTITGALSRDDLQGPGGRGYLQADGTFALPKGYTLDFHLIGVSDPAYLQDYGISDDDRLNSTIDVSRTQRNAWISASLTGIQSLRAGETAGSFPSLIGDFSLHRRFTPAILGGTAGFEVQTHTSLRESTSPLDGNGDGIADGRDLARLSARFDWRRNWLLTSGVEVSAIGLLSADDYQIAQDATYAGNALRAAGTAGVELRWPWTKAGAAATQTVEPVVQLVISPQTRANIPNEDSTLVEFDAGNLFTFDRFPGADAVEGGLRANLGVNYDAIFTNGLDLGMTVGRVVRLAAPTDFPVASGLTGMVSDWLVEWNLSDGTGRGLQLTNRLVISDQAALTKGEVRLDLERAHYDLSGGYSYVAADTQEDRPDPISELVFDAGHDVTDTWALRGTGRYNVAASKLAEAGVNLTFRNECLSMDLSLSRRFISSTSVKPSTDFGLSVELLGFGGSGLPGMARQCKG
jgi:LPS-assembly protein